MKTIEKSVIIWFSAQEMFNLVVDVKSYPRFLPWCDKTDILNETPDSMTARIGMTFGGLHKSFTTHNTHVAPQPPPPSWPDGDVGPESAANDWRSCAKCWRRPLTQRHRLGLTCCANDSARITGTMMHQ